MVDQLENELLSRELSILFGSTIGQHVRHILEFYECLIAGADRSIVCYDERKRRVELEEDRQEIQRTIAAISDKIVNWKEDRPMMLKASFSSEDGQDELMHSSLLRELSYCLEHMIHHLIIIKIALEKEQPELKMPENFGVAYSTIRHQKSCAQ